MTIKKSKRMRKIRYDIRGPICEEAERMEREGIPIVKLNTGNPAIFGFETPEYILSDIGRNAVFSSAYSQTKGIDSARLAIMEYCEDRGFSNVKFENIYTGNGVSELIIFSLQALLDPGDEVLVPVPDYPLWTAATYLAGGKPVHYRCAEQSEWFPDIEDIRGKISGRTKAIVIINPNNPTGAVYPRELLSQIMELARQSGLVVLSDEIYDRLVMDDYEHVSCAALAPDIPVMTFNGLSKSHNICGYRCGWMVLSGFGEESADYIEGFSTLASLRLCSNVPAQAVIPAALKDSRFCKGSIRPGGRLYEQRECAYTMLNDIPGISAIKPKAGLYIFSRLDTEALKIRDDELFVLDFLREKHVLLTHGRSYNLTEPNYFRVVYLPAEDELRDVLGRLKDFLSVYRQY